MLDKTNVHVHDAGSFDPTKTHAIRKRFKTEFQKRWVALAKLSTQAIMNKDLLGIECHTTQSIMYGGDKIKTFQGWIDEALNQIVFDNDGQWIKPYLINTYSHALKTSKIPVFGSTVSKSLPLLISSTKVEFKGIMEVASQQASRQVFNGLMARSQASKIARDVSAVIKSVGQRTNGLVDFMVVKTFNESLLDVFEHAGIKQVGVIPEHVPVKIMQDAAPKRKRSNVFKSTFKSRAQFQEVDILTAGDAKVCKICQGIANDGPYSMAEARGLIPAHPNCLPGNSLVTSIDGISATSERRFTGELIVIQTSSGRKLSCTPNHPILTDGGWKPANFLDVGSNVISHGGIEWESTFRINNNYKYMPTRIHDISGSFLKSSKMISMEMPTSSPDFHGDGMNGEIAIIRTNSELWNGSYINIFKEFKKFLLIMRNKNWNQELLFRFSSLIEFLRATLYPSHGVMCGRNLSLAFCRTHLAPFNSFSFRLPSSFRFMNLQDFTNSRSLNFMHFSKNIFGETPKIIPDNCFLDKVAMRSNENFTGHVYNLQTPSEMYVAQGIVTHNCRCSFTKSGDLPLFAHGQVPEKPRRAA